MPPDAEIRAEIRRLMEEIAVAFEGVPRPSTTRSVADAIDDEWIISVERAAEVARKDPEQRWQDVTDEMIVGSSNYFTFSDSEGWRFYLPAHLMYWLRNFPDADSDAGPKACVEDHPRFESLDARQLAAVRGFADFYLRMARAGRVSYF